MVVLRRSEVACGASRRDCLRSGSLLVAGGLRCGSGGGVSRDGEPRNVHAGHTGESSPPLLAPCGCTDCDSRRPPLARIRRRWIAST